jgi:2-isopropylmalate synthase
MMRQKIAILDTTLRDGQQCPGAGMSYEKNIEYAHLAAKVNVDILEAGFPAASRTDFKIVRQIADELLSESPHAPIIAALCQLREAQFDITIDALAPAITKKKGRLHVYVPVAPALMEASLGFYGGDKSKILNDMHRFVAKAVVAGLEVEVTPEGYSRQGENFDFTTDLLRAAVDSGATVLNCPDTIGGAYRLQQDYFVERMQQHADIIQREYPNKKLCWSAHCHNDFGLALDNSMNAVLFGPATQIEGCFNGLGERAGNVALEQCIMLIKQFGDARGEKYPALFTDINMTMLQSLSDFLHANVLPRQPHWPITGDNSAKHTSGGHINAILNNPLAYQPFDPKDVGKEVTFVFGPMSGGNHAKAVIELFGYRCEDDEKAQIAQYIKDVYMDRRKGITDEELFAAYLQYRQPIHVTGFNYSRDGKSSTLKMIGKFFDHAEGFEIVYNGDDSALAALNHAIEEAFQPIHVESYHSEAVSKGIRSISRTTIVIETNSKKLYTGVGQDQDIEISALKALIDAVNQAYIDRYLYCEHL